MPSSRTSKRGPLALPNQRTSMAPPSGLYRTALVTRLLKALYSSEPTPRNANPASAFTTSLCVLLARRRASVAMVSSICGTLTTSMVASFGNGADSSRVSVKRSSTSACMRRAWGVSFGNMPFSVAKSMSSSSSSSR